MSGATLSRADCCRVLGVEPYCSWEVVRQAYKDLVRVWHPDRFQSDPLLRSKAEQQLQRINEAYYALKNGKFAEPSPEPEAETPEPPPQPEPTQAEPRFDTRAYAKRRSGGQMWGRVVRWPARALWFGVMCLAPLAIGGVLLHRLQVPILDAVIGQDGQRPQILSPARYGISGQSTVDELSQWARGEAGALWNSIPKLGHGGSEAVAYARTTPAAPTAHPESSALPGAPANGTELLRPRTAGGSQIWVSNPGGRDVIATLVDAATATPVCSVFVQSRNKACIRHIGPGMYRLTAEAGEGWDTHRARFTGSRQTIERSGTFQCMDLTAGHMVSGRCFDVNGEDGTARPKNDIVLRAQ